jgi:hypothetical protein
VNLETGQESEASIVVSNGSREVMLPISQLHFEQIVGMWAELVGKSTGTVEPPAPKARAVQPVNGNGHGPSRAMPAKPVAPAPSAPVSSPFVMPEEEDDKPEVGENYSDPLTGFPSV